MPPRPLNQSLAQKPVTKNVKPHLTESTALKGPGRLAESRQEKIDHHFGMICYGVSGIGKTSLGAEFEDVCFVIDPHEHGIYDLLAFNQCRQPKHIIEVNGWQNVLKVSADLCTDRRFKTICYDSASGLQMMCFKHHCDTYFGGDWSNEGFFAYQQGPKNAANRDWPDLLDAFEALRGNQKNVLVLAHSQIKPFKNPGGADYDRYSPCLEKEIWATTHRWATAVLFYCFDLDVQKQGGKHKGDASTEHRVLCTVHSQAKYDAKNRYGLDPYIIAEPDPGVNGFPSTTIYQKFMRQYLRGMQ